MVFGLSKPSRSYASQAAGIWDASSGFADPSASEIGRGSRSRDYREDDGRSGTGRRQVVRSGSYEGTRRRVPASSDNDIRDSPRSTKSAGRAARVSFSSQDRPPVPTIPNRLKTASSVSGFPLTTASTHKPPISKRERQRRTDQLQAELANFSVADLAPPTLKSRIGGGDGREGEDSEDYSPADSMVDVPREEERSQARKKKGKGRMQEMGGDDDDGASTGYLGTEPSENEDTDMATRKSGTNKAKSVSSGTATKKKSKKTTSVAPSIAPSTISASQAQPQRSTTPTPMPKRRISAIMPAPLGGPIYPSTAIDLPLDYIPQRPPLGTFYNSHGVLTPPSSDTHNTLSFNNNNNHNNYNNRARSLSPIDTPQLLGGGGAGAHRGHSLSYGPSSPWHIMIRPDPSAMPSRKYSRNLIHDGHEVGYVDEEIDERERSRESSVVGSDMSNREEGREGDEERHRRMMMMNSVESSPREQEYEGLRAGQDQIRRTDSPPKTSRHTQMETIYSQDSVISNAGSEPVNLRPIDGLPSLGAVIAGPTMMTTTSTVPAVQIIEMPTRTVMGDPTGPQTPDAPNQADGLAPPTFSVQPPTPQHEREQPDLQSPNFIVQQEEREIKGESGVVQSPAVHSEVTQGYAPSQIQVMGPPSPNPISRPAPQPIAQRQINSQSSSAANSQESSPRSSYGPTSGPSSSERGIKPSRSTPNMPPAPTDPDQPAFLKWDTKSQRWTPVPISGPNTGLQAPGGANGYHRAESVASSISAYSQASAPAPPGGQQHYTSSRNRRQSLPPLSMAMAPPRPSRRGQSPSPSLYNSRTTSPAPSEGGFSRTPTSPSANTFPNRRMSIEAPHRMEANTLTLLPELHEDGSAPSIDVSPSRPSSRIGSIRDFRRDSTQSRPESRTQLGALAFPPMNGQSTRSSPAGSENGDEHGQDRPESIYTRPKSRNGSLYAASQYAGSQYGGTQFGDNAGPRKAPSVIGREPGLATMSQTSEPVPLLQNHADDANGNGYTSLVLPTGSYKPTADPTKDLNKIDPRILGMPHSTMSTITMSPSSGRLSRRNSIASIFKPTQSPTPAHLLGDVPAPVTFSSTIAPPTKISDSQVLVQVYAVAIDKFDADMVREKAAAGSGGGKWIPGRSFFGRALDVGGEVRTIIKGDLVIGLVDIKKSGTLAEYITCDRRRIARVPFGCTLSQEEITCLPLLGVMAHRACIAVARGSRAFILNAHEGVGSLVCQELAANGVLVTAQVPVDVDEAEEDAWNNGAREVLVGEPIPLINLQHESGFDYILDTVGGRKIYDASRRIMRTNGRFVTLHGDDAAKPTTGTQVKTSLHALRRAFVKKDKKAINYIHILPGGGDVDLSGQDTRDILELPIMSEYRPKVGMVLPFERAPEGFEELAGMFPVGNGSGGTGAGAVGTMRKEVSGEIVVRLNN